MRLSFLYCLVLLLYPVPIYSVANPDENWIIKQKTTGFEYNTETKMGSRKGITKKGLISVSKSKEKLLISLWESGAYRATLNYNDKTIVDGYDIEDVSRINSFRFDKSGSTVFIRTTKGPSAVVELFQDEKAILEWPRLSIVKILKYDVSAIYITVYLNQTQITEFWRYDRSDNGTIEKKGTKIGELKSCTLLGSKVLRNGIAIETYCNRETGNDVKFLKFATGKVQDVLATSEDEFLAFSLLKSKADNIPVLTITGNNNAKHFYHAIYGSLMKLLGEPMSLASDESGKQSWSQSYRTLTLASLYQQTRHPVFAKLAEIAITNTLKQRNQELGISGDFNPENAWASRIYSEDGKTPISFMINQAMIMTGLIKGCDFLQDRCPVDLKQEIDNSSIALVEKYEKWFDHKQYQYRIPYGAPFRFDGIWAPWNWQMMWTVILKHAGNLGNNPEWVNRAENIGAKFLESWEFSNDENPRALWRYWTPAYYDGWDKDDLVSSTRVSQKPKNMNKERYEDLNHAGISLLGLSFSNLNLTSKQTQSAKNTINRILGSGNIFARDMNGNGPISPRWLPGAGWHLFETKSFRELYTHKLPGAVSSDQHLAYAYLYNQKESFALNLTLSTCVNDRCGSVNEWKYYNAQQFLTNNPFFSISAK